MAPRYDDLPPAISDTIFPIRSAGSHGVSIDRLRRLQLEGRVHGVRGPAGSAEDLEGLCRLFAARLGAGVFFSHVTAARLLDVPLPRAFERSTPVHVTVAAPRRAPHASGLIGHSRRVEPGDVFQYAGLSVSSPPRLLGELAGILDLPQLVAVADRMIDRRRPWCRLEQLVARFEIGDRVVRSRRLRRALGLADGRSESPAESIVRVVLTLAGLKPTATNLEVVALGRRYRIDLAYVDEKVAVEYQGAHHLDGTFRRSDMTRRAHLEAAGWTVVELNSDQLADHAQIVALVRSALRRSRR